MPAEELEPAEVPEQESPTGEQELPVGEWERLAGERELPTGEPERESVSRIEGVGERRAPA